MRSSWKVVPSVVTDPSPPSSFSRMLSAYVFSPLTTLPCTRTAPADSAAVRVLPWIFPAGSLPTPLVPSFGSSAQPVSTVPVTSSAHIALASTALRLRPWRIGVTGGAASLRGDLNGVPQGTGHVRPGRSQSVRTARRRTADRDGLA
ncbi:hypothetical protein SPURM210S_03517 [Streptomyces purpurascens]